MKRTTITLLILLIGTFCLTSCESTESSSEWECGMHNGNTLYTGPEGGCYYYNSNENKTYVDRSECNC